MAKKAANKKQPLPLASPPPDQKTLSIQQAIDLAMQHSSAGDLSRAESICQQILQSDPDHPVALNLLGGIAHQVGKTDIAADLIGKALATRPDYAEANYNLGIVLKHQGKLDEAVASLQKALDVKPDYAEAHSTLGNTFKDQGKPDDAVACYHKALAIKPDFIEAYSNLGNVLKDQGRLDDAVASFQKAIAIRPDFFEAHCNLGNVLENQGKPDEAVSSYHKALAINPESAGAHYNLGKILKNQGKLEDAVACYQKAIAIKPDFVEAYSNLGNVFADQGKLDEAVASFHRAIAIRPDFAEAYSNLGNVFADQGKLDDAVSSYQKALAINPGYAEANYNLGNVLKNQGKLVDAVASFHRALAIRPDYPEAWNNLKYVTRVLQFTECGEDQAGNVSTHELNADARSSIDFTLQQFYLARFRPHEADDCFEKTIATLPSRAEQTIPINSAGHINSAGQGKTEERLADKVVALLHFGRSGTGLLHSLIDGHREISTLPSVYLRGYFNDGLWGRLCANGLPRLPERFADEFAVLFDARSSKPIPSRLGELSSGIGVKEGMTSVGENRDEFLFLDRKAFCNAASGLMEGMKSIDPMSFLMVVHAAFEEVTGSQVIPGREKHLCFYHIHNPDDYAMLNFLHHAPDARILMSVREPVQNCESWLSLNLDDYDKCVHLVLKLLFDIDQVPFRKRESAGIRLEDLKARPEATLEALCAWLGVGHSSTLYEMTAQGKKWWGDPSSPDYGKDTLKSPFDDTTIKRPVGSILGERDQFVLGTLFYPFSVRFGYREPDTKQFKKDLKDIRPLIDDMLDFEKALIERSGRDQEQFRQRVTCQLLRAGLIERWNVLDEFGDYPHMLAPLSIA